jgi:LysR family hydrogen peroxide-inducible transcriptional activator
MEIQEIQYFLALCETLNFTRAAHSCGVSQPALTRGIKSLEDKLGGGPLIHRERGNTHLTELGRMMRPYFEQVVAQMEEARKRAREAVHLNDSKLTVGLLCTIGPSRLIDLFSGFVARYEGIELSLRDARANALEEMLEAGEIDVAIYCKPEALREDLHHIPLYQERFMIALPPRHPLARRQVIRMRDLDGARYLCRVNCDYAAFVRATAESQGVRFTTPYASDRDDWIQAMVRSGLGYTILPEHAAAVPGLVLRPLAEPEVARRVHLVTLRGRPHSPAVGAFVHEASRYPWEEKLRGAPMLGPVEAAE